MKTAFEILQSKLTVDDTSEFRLTHIPEILEAMEEYKAQLPQQETFLSKETSHRGNPRSDAQFPQQEISDDQAIKMLQDMNKQPMRFHCVPKEISDEEIEKASYKFWEFKEHTKSTSWKMGAKWYREQLKQRQ